MSEMQLGTTDCGCAIYVFTVPRPIKDGVMVKYCPEHKAAPTFRALLNHVSHEPYNPSAWEEDVDEVLDIVSRAESVFAR